MHEKLEKLLLLLKQFLDQKRSCQIRLNLHEGNLSDKVEVKESVNLDE